MESPGRVARPRPSDQGIQVGIREAYAARKERQDLAGEGGRMLGPDEGILGSARPRRKPGPSRPTRRRSEEAELGRSRHDGDTILVVQARLRTMWLRQKGCGGTLPEDLRLRSSSRSGDGSARFGSLVV